ncbi:hypothetical protein B0T22DRAFT_457522 [Podospora appendiculata]|uniref:Uncharacterized protein n=1 Tax=Podospora appendiculata TaxID=314037 RepID=A0AAE0X7R9_9PEZI|nr:hypothetical protein B0T22DRAFT_457522 [Podospora appendiculata]
MQAPVGWLSILPKLPAQHQTSTLRSIMADKLQPEGAPSGRFQDNSYVSRPETKHEPIQVISDSERVGGIDPNVADTDAQLGGLQRRLLSQLSRLEQRRQISFFFPFKFI